MEVKRRNRRAKQSSISKDQNAEEDGVGGRNRSLVTHFRVEGCYQRLSSLDTTKPDCCCPARGKVCDYPGAPWTEMSAYHMGKDFSGTSAACYHLFQKNSHIPILLHIHAYNHETGIFYSHPIKDSSILCYFRSQLKDLNGEETGFSSGSSTSTTMSYANAAGSKFGQVNKEWFEHIEQDFIRFFREILEGMNCLLDNDVTQHGNLENGICICIEEIAKNGVFSTEKKAKLYRMIGKRVAESSKPDLVVLAEIMEAILRLGDELGTKNFVSVPQSLRSFLQIAREPLINYSKLLDRERQKLLYNNPYFWTFKKRRNFMMVVYEMVYKHHLSSTYETWCRLDDNWVQKIYNNLKPGIKAHDHFRGVLKQSSYKTGISIVRFYRDLDIYEYACMQRTDELFHRLFPGLLEELMIWFEKWMRSIYGAKANIADKLWKPEPLLVEEHYPKVIFA